MTGDGWERIKELFEAALLHAPETRSHWLAEVCADSEIRREVESLLASHGRAGEFLQHPVAVGAAEVVSGLGRGARAGEVVGAWRLLEEIGRGGMGTVWLAERADGVFEKRVALKLVSRGLETDVILRRFHLERQILASLNHPNITTLLDGGATLDGTPYLVMQHVDGSPITEFCRKRGLSLRDRLELYCNVCEAVAYAHRNQVLHRDLKPSNILVTADGVVKLLDFGVAKLLTAEPAAEATLRAPLQMLTPEYASPEQARGDPVAESSDVYSLGVLLYELVAGCRPYEFQTRSPQEVFSLICEREPPKPSVASRRAELKGDLDSIVAMALRKEPERRYASVGALAADVRGYLEGRPVRAVPPTIGYRTLKLLRRRGGTVAAAAALVILAGLVFWQATRRPNSAQPTAYRHSTIAAANEYYERALAVEKADFAEERVLQLYQHAVELDPHFTAARSRLGFYQLSMIDHGLSNDRRWLERAEVELRRAEREDPRVASTYSFLSVLSFYRREWDQMEREGKTAVRLDPGDIDAAMSLVPLWRLLDDYPQVMALCRRALQRDPGFMLARINLADAYRLAGDPQRCIRELETLPEPERALPTAVIFTAAFLDRGELVKARQALERTRPEDRGNYYHCLSKALLLAREGKVADARRELDSAVIRWVDLIPEGPVLAAEIYSVIGDTGEALEWLDKGVRGGDHRKSWFLLDPQLANIRGSDRFRQILASIPSR